MSVSAFRLVIICVSLSMASGCQNGTSVTGDTNASSEPAATAIVPPQDAKIWLETGLTGVSEEIADAPVRLFDAKLEHNEFGQELLSVSYERPKVVRTMAAQVTLVLQPISGGRQEVYVPNGILIQPQSEGRLNGITDQLLDHRGRFPEGAREYLEMRAATINGAGQKPIRVSAVCWLGTNDQLTEAIKHYPSGPPSDTKAPLAQLKSVPGGPLYSGTPLWMKCGDRWARGHAIADANGDNVRLLIFLVRRDNPYLPWEYTASRSELRIEKPAMQEFARDPRSFQDLADSIDSKLSRMGAAKKLQRVNENELPVGTPVLDFWNGMLDPCIVVGQTKDGVTPIKRVGLDNAEMSKPVKGLFLDPLSSP